VAVAVVPSLPLYSAPGAPAPVGHLANPNPLGAPLALLVTAYQGDWVQAYVPLRPNESTAWFPRADVSISADPYHITVSIAAHQLVLYRDNVAVFTTTVATGAPSSPTPTGSYFVAYIVKLTDPQDAYGPYAMGTSAFSNTYVTFEGGPGQVGIHGTNQPWVIGQYASHGCIRLTNDAVTTVATQIPPGTPVEISP
jgi:lipoprotein-anchoring transpeptidase ErfK/SrfK